MQNIKYALLCVSLLLACFCVEAQDWVWAKGAGGTSVDSGKGVAIDSQGNQYVTGYFDGTATFGTTTLISSGGIDIFVAKLDENGNWIWARKAGGVTTYDEVGLDVAVDNNANVYLTGVFYNTAYFGNLTLTANGWGDVFVAKLDTDGNWIWAKNAGGAGPDKGSGITLDNSTNIYITGSYQGTATFGSTSLISIGYEDIFVAKLDCNGNWIWAKSAGGPLYNNVSTGIAVDSSANVYLTGYYFDTVTFGSTILTCVGRWDIFCAKLDTTGNWLWAIRAGGSGYDQGSGIAVDSSDNVYLTGYYDAEATFGNTSITSYGTDLFVAKLDSNGNWLWVRNAGGTGSDISSGIVVDDLDNVYVTGQFNAPSTIGPTVLFSSGGYDVFAAKIDVTGNWIWAKSGGGASDDYSADIAVYNSTDVSLIGNFSGTASFDAATLTSNGGTDILVAKCGLGDTQTRITENSFSDKSCKLGIPVLLEANLQYQGFLSLWYDLNDKPISFQIFQNGVWTNVPDDGIAATSLNTGGADNPSGFSRVYYTPPASVTPGNYPFRVVFNGDSTYSNCLLERTLTVIKPQWLTIVYMCGDDNSLTNNIEELTCIDYFNEMWQARGNIDVSVVALIDRGPGHFTGVGDWTETRTYYLCADTNIYTSMGELNMGDPNTLYNFVQNTLNACPAYNVSLILWGHGSGVRRDSTDIGGRHICFDDTDSDVLSLREIRSVVSSFSSGTFDVISFDACLMGMAEIAYDMKQYCNYFVASEDEMTGFAYQNFLTTQYLNASTTPAQYCDAIVNGTNQNTLGAWNISGDYIDNLKTAISNMADDLILCMQNDRASTFSFIVSALEASQRFADYLNEPMAYTDLLGFTSYIYANSGYSPLVIHAGQIISILNNTQFRTSWSNNYNDTVGGLSIYFPAIPNSGWDYYFSANGVLFNQNNDWGVFLTYYFDAMEPSLTFTSPYSSQWYSGLITSTTVPFETGDFVSGILNVEFQYSLDRSNWYPLPGPDSANGIDWDVNNGWSLRFDTVGTPVHGTINDSSVWIRARAKDKAGNIGLWVETINSFGVDNAAPTLTSTSLSAPKENTSSLISSNSTETLSGMASTYPRLYYRYGNSNVNASSPYIVLNSRFAENDCIISEVALGQLSVQETRMVYTGSLLINPNTEGTSLYWKYMTQDNVGNYLWSSVSFASIQDNDTQGPITTQMSGPYNGFPGTNIFIASISDASGINWSGNPPRLYYRYNNSTIDLTLNDGYVSFTNQQIATLFISGNHVGDHLYWRIYATDADTSPASSWSSVQDAGVIQNDEPELVISTLSNVTVDSSVYNIEGSAQDSWNGITIIQLKINSGNWATIWSGSENDVDWNSNVLLALGNNTIYARAQDTFGVYSEIDSINVSYSLPNLDAPTGVAIIHNASGLRLQWNAVQYANRYSVYSSINPFADTQSWTLEQADVTQTFWIDNTASAIRKFFLIRALRD